MYLSFPNVTKADLGLYIVSIPLDGEYIDSPSISLRVIGMLYSRPPGPPNTADFQLPNMFFLGYTIIITPFTAVLQFRRLFASPKSGGIRISNLIKFVFNMITVSEWWKAEGACGNVGEDVNMRAVVQAQYLPTPSDIKWENLKGDKVRGT